MPWEPRRRCTIERILSKSAWLTEVTSEDYTLAWRFPMTTMWESGRRTQHNEIGTYGVTYHQRFSQSSGMYIIFVL